MLKVDYFDPVVDDWNEEAQKREFEEKKNCNYHLYVITPKMRGVFSVAEAVDDSNKIGRKTILCILRKDENRFFNKFQMRSLNAFADIVKKNDGRVFYKLADVVHYFNGDEGMEYDLVWDMNTEPLTKKDIDDIIKDANHKGSIFNRIKNWFKK
jgi:hypothetical protein